ncbi:LysE family transporter [Thiomonas bhubaneswarensis]|uniref:Threonine/homoserine/homoserine lactone efflux protein n=1 Tax=Thiomonas bhubaneswarensis TaxID=339866 RepID=A0A0K6HSU2_9BURK|nr:LysE family transporter [Thiomonas bhubaneswarensis]CUA93848.1 Threonine/homoserine/homoserine lactone efflux protein [Thiomonas bhubaneswarensis]
MDLHTWLTFFAASWLISLSPGAGAISCMTAGLRFGWRLGVWNILGLQLGIAAILVVVAAGLGAVLAASETAFSIIKWFGVAYLLWLGIQQWRAPAHGMAEADGHAKNTEPPTRTQLVLRGFLINASNPKGLVFMLAVLPQFINPAEPQLHQYLLCGLSLFITDIVVMNAYTLLAARLLVTLRSPQHQLWLQRSFGTLFIGAALLLSAFRRST